MSRKTLSTLLVERLKQRIMTGLWAPGAQLPTESELCAEFAVSRTVVREAVAQLRADGLVIARQGKGVFVSEAPPRPGFSVPDEALASLAQTLSLLELRLAVEVESAGRCAERCSPEQARHIRAEMNRVDAPPADPDHAQIHYDYPLHLAIAEGAGNPQILGFLAYLQPLLTQAFRLGDLLAPGMSQGYFDRIHAEHLAVVTAIEARDGETARAAMRLHLESSLDRLRALARRAGLAEDHPLPRMDLAPPIKPAPAGAPVAASALVETGLPGGLREGRG